MLPAGLSRVFSFLPAVIMFFMLTAGFFIPASLIADAPLCFYKLLFQFDCPGCGLTRAFLLIPRGELLSATRLNWAGPAVYFLFTLFFLRSISRKLGVSQRGFNFFYQKIVGISGAVVIMLLLAHWVYKVGVFFSERSLWDYLKQLAQNPLFWLFIG